MINVVRENIEDEGVRKSGCGSMIEAKPLNVNYYNPVILPGQNQLFCEEQ